MTQPPESPFAVALAAMRSVTAYVSISLYVLLAAPPGILVALMIRSVRHLYWLGFFGVRLGFFLTGIRFRVAGLEHVQTGRAAVYCMNHTSNVEPPIVFAVLRALHPRLSVLYKAELRKLPILVRGFDVAGFVPVERGNREQSVPAIERAADMLRRGTSFMIFPEGTRSRTGELLPFKKGGFVMALKAGAPIVPVALQGARAAMRKGSPWVRPVTVSVRFGPPIETSGLGLDRRDRVIGDVRARIQALLAEGPVG